MTRAASPTIDRREALTLARQSATRLRLACDLHAADEYAAAETWVLHLLHGRTLALDALIRALSDDPERPAMPDVGWHASCEAANFSAIVSLARREVEIGRFAAVTDALGERPALSQRVTAIGSMTARVRCLIVRSGLPLEGSAALLASATSRINAALIAGAEGDRARAIEHSGMALARITQEITYRALTTPVRR